MELIWTRNIVKEDTYKFLNWIWASVNQYLNVDL